MVKTRERRRKLVLFSILRGNWDAVAPRFSSKASFLRRPQEVNAPWNIIKAVNPTTGETIRTYEETPGEELTRQLTAAPFGHTEYAIGIMNDA
jgi:hypothetical protein